MGQKSKPEPRKLKTLDRVLSKLGAGSRTEAKAWIEAGRVAVNGRIVRDPEQWADLERDRFQLDGQPLAEGRKLYLLLYKPKGYLTTHKDPAGRPTVYDLTRTIKTWIFPVGRLDLDTSGLLLMTNDSELAERITNPDFHVPKTYLVKTATRLTSEQLDQLRHGVVLKDGPTRPAEVTHLRDSGSKTFFEITITEGRNRQVRRMVEALGSHVLKLVRVRLGPLSIGDLAIGNWRKLRPDELAALKRPARAPRPPRPDTPSPSP